MDKEELKKEFYDFMRRSSPLTPAVKRIFDFFYSHIESRDKEIEEQKEMFRQVSEQLDAAIIDYDYMFKENKRLREIVEAGDAYIKAQIEVDRLACQTGGNPETITKAEYDMLNKLSDYTRFKQQ